MENKLNKSEFIPEENWFGPFISKGLTESMTKAVQEELKVRTENIKFENNLPIEVFSDGIKEIISESSKCLTYPPDYIAPSLMFAASVAIGNTFKVSGIEGWEEAPVFYFVLVGRSGSNKSAPIEFALKPLLTKDETCFREYQQKNIEYEKMVALQKKEKKSADMAGLVKPKLTKMIMQDFTLEALIRVHAVNARGIGVYADELASWLKNFTRYSNGSEEQTWLTFWSGKTFSSNRVSSEPIMLSKPCISVIGGVQPKILNDLFNGSKGQNGFKERLLFSIPENQDKPHLSRNKLNSKVVDNWKRYLANLVDLKLVVDENNVPKPTILYLSPEAEEAFRKWQWQNTELINSIENDAIRSIYSKLDSYILRFALLLQLMAWASDEGNKERVELNAFMGAIKLVEYYRKTALKVHSLMYHQDHTPPKDFIKDPLASLADNKRELLENLPDTFTTADIVALGSSLDQPLKERTIKDFLKDNALLKKISHGLYRKNY